MKDSEILIRKNKILSAVRLLSLILFIVFTCSALSPPYSEAEEKDPPNILLVTADDYGVDVSSLYTDLGGENIPTPNIEALAAQGVLFTNAVVAPGCSPTRANILTGRYSLRTGVSWIIGRFSTPTDDPPTQVDTSDPFLLPKLLKTEGYATALIGKWHMTANLSDPSDTTVQDDPLEAGFDFWTGTQIGPGQRGYFNRPKIACDYTDPNHPECSVVGSQVYATTDEVDDAISWIHKQDSPWFLWLSFNAPHAPFQLPPRELVDPAIVDEVLAAAGGEYTPGQRPGEGLLENTRDNRRLVYRAMISAMDTELGRLMHDVDLANTRVIFLGDNCTPNEVVDADAFDPARAKHALYQGGVSVPMIVAGPGIKKRGRTSKALVDAVDIHATVLESAGVRDDALDDIVTDSMSIVPILKRRSKNFSIRKWSFVEHIYPLGFNPGVDPMGINRFFGGEFPRERRAIRNKRFKLIIQTALDLDGSVTGLEGSFICISGEQPSIENPVPCSFADRVTEFELYDLKEDPQELNNLLLKRQLTVKKRKNFDELSERIGSLRDRLIP